MSDTNIERTERKIHQEVRVHERALEALYLERRGMRLHGGGGAYWCAICGQCEVFPSSGDDTCKRCLADVCGPVKGATCDR